MSLIIVLGQFDIHPEDAPAAAELMRVMMSETVKEPGCHHYAYSRGLSDSGHFELSELWQDDASLAAHFQTSHMAAYRAGMSRLRVLSRAVKRYDAANATNL